MEMKKIMELVDMSDKELVKYVKEEFNKFAKQPRLSSIKGLILREMGVEEAQSLIPDVDLIKFGGAVRLIKYKGLPLGKLSDKDEQLIAREKEEHEEKYPDEPFDMKLKCIMWGDDLGNQIRIFNEHIKNIELLKKYKGIGSALEEERKAKARVLSIMSMMNQLRLRGCGLKKIVFSLDKHLTEEEKEKYFERAEHIELV